MAERSSAAALQQLESKNLELQSLQERLLKIAKDVCLLVVLINSNVVLIYFWLYYEYHSYASLF